jgi:hypothetical protein
MTINKRELEKVARLLKAALAIIEAELEPIVVPDEIQAEVDRKLQNRTCLAWDHAIPDGERVTRGLCMTDYSTTMARIRRGEESERELIVTGKLTAEAAKSGRKAARDLAQAEKLRIVAEDVANYKKNQAAKKAKGDEK